MNLNIKAVGVISHLMCEYTMPIGYDCGDFMTRLSTPAVSIAHLCCCPYLVVNRTFRTCYEVHLGHLL